jgi:NADP-dependent 3-hydroxy acid dehydrogenase YdfG
MQHLISNHNRIDILINNAGYHFNSGIWYKEIHITTDDELDKIIEVDLKGSVHYLRQLLITCYKRCNRRSNN